MILDPAVRKPAEHAAKAPSLTSSTPSPTKERAWGTLAGCALGDAMGMPTEFLSRKDMARLWPDGVDDLYPSSALDVFGRKMAAGEVTDDTLNTLFVVQMLDECGGRCDAMRLIELLVSWTEAHPEKAGFVVGPSTTKALAAIRSGSPIERAGIFGTTNGAAMKVSPIGVAYDYRHMEELVDAVEELARPTHNTGVAIACAAAVAAAVSYGARGGSDLDELWEIALDAAREGETRGYALPTARMSERLSEVHERVASESMPESLRLLRELYGCGVESIETGPAAVAIASLSEGDPWRAACMAAGIGGDTDTLGAIACAICGAMHPEKLPVDKIALIEQVNNLCLRDAAEKLAALAR